MSKQKTDKGASVDFSPDGKLSRAHGLTSADAAAIAQGHAHVQNKDGSATGALGNQQTASVAKVAFQTGQPFWRKVKWWHVVVVPLGLAAISVWKVWVSKPEVAPASTALIAAPVNVTAHSGSTAVFQNGGGTVNVEGAPPPSAANSATR